MRDIHQHGGVSGRLTSWLVIAVSVAGLTSCGGGRPAARPSADSAEDTTTHESAPPAPAPVADQPAPAAQEEYVVRGACPFECCKYGDHWSLLHGGVLRSEPNGDADSVGSVADGATVQTDEGAMVLHPPGVATVVPDTSHNAGGPAIGDTVAVITYTGAKVAHVRSHGQEFDMNWSALHMSREPVQTWWVHMTDPVSGESVWLLMSGGISAEGVGAKNACGGH